MGNTDSVPLVSQVKSGVQLVCGDTDGAARTQVNFVRQCPGVSQVTSLVQLAAGDADGALETQKQCVKGISNLADGIPVVGHAKGLVHYACGDKEGGHAAMKSATRTTGVVAGGATGFLLAGPVGAVAGGIEGGLLMDAGTTVVTGQNSGYIAAIDNAINNPNPGDIFDLAMMPVSDGLTGHAAGRMVQKIQTRSSANASQPQQQTQPQTQPKPSANSLAQAENLRSEGWKIYEAAENQKMEMTNAQYLNEMKMAQDKFNLANKLEGRVQAEQFVQKQHQQIAKWNQVRDQAKVKAGGSGVKTGTTGGITQQQSSSSKKSESERDEQIQRESLPSSIRAPRQRQQQQQRQRTRERKEREDESSSSSSSDEEECTCEDITRKVLYVNMGSINPQNRTASMRDKLNRLSALIRQESPAIIAIVETWLNGRHEDEEIIQRLNIWGYNVERQDRRDGHHPNNAYGHKDSADARRRGGGILLAWRNISEEFQIIRDPSEDFADNIVNFEIHCNFRCSKCNDDENSKKFAFTVVYRRPGATQTEIADPLVHLPSWFEDVLGGFSGWCMVGDFNWLPNAEALNNILYHVRDTGTIFVMPSTHTRGNTLDYVIASQDFVDGGVYTSDEPVSDHYALIFDLKFGKDYADGDDCATCESE